MIVGGWIRVISDNTEIKTSIDGATGIVRLNRPDTRNAITDKMLNEVQRTLQTWEMEREIAAVVLTGDDQAFSAGGDLKGSAASDMPPFDKYRYRHNQSVWHLFIRFLDYYTKPVIAAVEGYALGGGLELMLRCDFAIGSETAKLGLTEAKLGLFPILGGAWSLTQAIGQRRARETAYTGRRIGAEKALELGLFNHVTPQGSALKKALEIASEIASSAPLSVMALKQAIARAPRQTFDEALTAGGDLSALLMFSEDRNEGLKAFTEKRPPEFKGE